MIANICDDDGKPRTNDGTLFPRDSPHTPNTIFGVSPPGQARARASGRHDPTGHRSPHRVRFHGPPDSLEQRVVGRVERALVVDRLWSARRRAACGSQTARRTAPRRRPPPRRPRFPFHHRRRGGRPPRRRAPLRGRRPRGPPARHTSRPAASRKPTRRPCRARPRVAQCGATCCSGRSRPTAAPRPSELAQPRAPPSPC